jgi:hypothetical protein
MYSVCKRTNAVLATPKERKRPGDHGGLSSDCDDLACGVASGGDAKS